jgi:hypothetical protein
MLVIQLKICERNMQDLTNTIKRPNLRIMDIEEKKRSKQKGFVIHSIK